MKYVDINTAEKLLGMSDEIYTSGKTFCTNYKNQDVSSFQTDLSFHFVDMERLIIYRNILKLL